MIVSFLHSNPYFGVVCHFLFILFCFYCRTSLQYSKKVHCSKGNEHPVWFPMLKTMGPVFHHKERCFHIYEADSFYRVKEALFSILKSSFMNGHRNLWNYYRHTHMWVCINIHVYAYIILCLVIPRAKWLFCWLSLIIFLICGCAGVLTFCCELTFC